MYTWLKQSKKIFLGLKIPRIWILIRTSFSRVRFTSGYGSGFLSKIGSLSSLFSKIGSLFFSHGIPDPVFIDTYPPHFRKERLAFVNKSLNKALPSSQTAKKPTDKKLHMSSDSSSSSDSEDEPMMLRKCRTVSN